MIRQVCRGREENRRKAGWRRKEEQEGEGGEEVNLVVSEPTQLLIQ